MFFAFLCGCIASEHIKTTKSRGISPTLLSENVSVESNIRFERQKTETYVMKYAETEGVVYLPTQTMVSATDNEGKIIQDRQVASLTYVETITQTRMWWVLKEEVEVTVFDASREKVLIGILGGCCAGLVAILLITNICTIGSCSLSSISSTESDGRIDENDAAIVNYAQEMNENGEEDESSAPQMPVPQAEPQIIQDTPEVPDKPEVQPSMPENPYEEEVRNDWD